MRILYISIQHMVSVTYDTRSRPTDLGSRIAEMILIYRLPIYQNHIPIVLVLHHCTAQETLSTLFA